MYFHDFHTQSRRKVNSAMKCLDFDLPQPSKTKLSPTVRIRHIQSSQSSLLKADIFILDNQFGLLELTKSYKHSLTAYFTTPQLPEIQIWVICCFCFYFSCISGGKKGRFSQIHEVRRAKTQYYVVVYRLEDELKAYFGVLIDLRRLPWFMWHQSCLQFANGDKILEKFMLFVMDFDIPLQIMLMFP